MAWVVVVVTSYTDVEPSSPSSLLDEESVDTWHPHEYFLSERMM